ncbi:unnamed protein product [Heligmosomoides polygyrus]|uniref:Galactosylgalactosylxylosylprotein 3-beta-glucuronosyltransferase n=1 Tax=Heligmosomoides polygyrus TaxID=6339 RepID=A0A183GW39_HELPZ|nr:unnamed protein product [Heligmosomoides polygyrus]
MRIHPGYQFICMHFRLSQTLNHVRNLHWIVVEDGATTVNVVDRLLFRSTIPYVYLATTTAPGMPSRGWTHRNLALEYIRENYSPQTDAILYFADDDNSYDVRLFENYIRKVKRLGIWPVGQFAFELFIHVTRARGAQLKEVPAVAYSRFQVCWLSYSRSCQDLSQHISRGRT